MYRKLEIWDQIILKHKNRKKPQLMKLRESSVILNKDINEIKILNVYNDSIIKNTE